jgi:hypothetical protein
MALAVVQSQPTRLRQSPQDIRAVVESLRRRHKAADNARIAELLLELVGEDRALLRVAVRFVVDRIAAQQRPTVRERIARQAAHAAEKIEVKALAAKVKELVLLDLMMPNGVAMRFCSGTQMAGFGTAYEKIAERAGTAMVGEVMVEAEVKALLCAPPA